MFFTRNKFLNFQVVNFSYKVCGFSVLLKKNVLPKLFSFNILRYYLISTLFYNM